MNYLEEFRRRREKVESQWDIDIKDNSKSSFDSSDFHSEDGVLYCFNAKKYTLKEACDIAQSAYKGLFTNVAKSYARHRCGTSEDGPCCSWWCGDDERGYHSVPVWMFCDDEDYPTIEEALAKARGLV